MTMPFASDDAWAEIRAHGRVIRYRRMGVGRTVVVLGASPAPDPFWRALIGGLQGFRLIAPEAPAEDVDVHVWLAHFLDGLGAQDVTVLAAERFCTPVLELARRGTHPIVRVVLLAESRDVIAPGAAESLAPDRLAAP